MSQEGSERTREIVWRHIDTDSKRLEETLAESMTLFLQLKDVVLVLLQDRWERLLRNTLRRAKAKVEDLR